MAFEGNDAQQNEEWIEHHLLWHRLAHEHLYAEPDSEAGLAARLNQWRDLKSKRREWRKLQIANRKFPLKGNPYLKDANKLKAQILRAHHDLDMPFLRRLWNAVNRVAEGRVSKPVEIVGAALLAQWELRQELQAYPSHYQVRERVELWRKQGELKNWKISDKHWNERVLPKIAGLFPKRLS